MAAAVPAALAFLVVEAFRVVGLVLVQDVPATAS
jgi:hypothetical protein